MQCACREQGAKLKWRGRRQGGGRDLFAWRARRLVSDGAGISLTMGHICIFPFICPSLSSIQPAALGGQGGRESRTPTPTSSLQSQIAQECG